LKSAITTFERRGSRGDFKIIITGKEAPQWESFFTRQVQYRSINNVTNRKEN